MSTETFRAISGATRVFAILGDPVRHSLSPLLHNAAFAATGIDAVFVALPVSGDAVAHALRTIAAAGGGGSITVPHKELAARCIERPGEAVLRTGACNTFWAESNAICGDNTDVVGFRAAVHHHGVTLRDARVLLLGAGGAAAAVLAVLQDEAAQVVLCNRSPERAHALLARLRAPGTVVTEPPARPFDVIINATSLGLHPADPMPLPLDRVPTGAVLLDVVYAPATTPWVRAARARGIVAFDGAEMLLRQAAAAFQHWTGVTAPVHVMRAALGSVVAA